MQGSKQPQLEYVPVQDFHRRIVRRVVFWIAVLAAGGILIAISPQIIRRARLLSLQRQCLEYTPTTGQIVFDTRLESMPSLPRSDPEYVTGQLDDKRPYVGYIPAQWNRYCALMSATQPKAAGTAFLHEIRSPGGNQRLVVVSAYQLSNLCYFSGIVITPGSFHTAPIVACENTATWFLHGQSVVYAGQRDPGRPEHFSIEFLDGTRHEFLDGWLRDDDVMTLEFRRSPLTPPSPPSPASSH